MLPILAQEDRCNFVWITINAKYGSGWQFKRRTIVACSNQMKIFQLGNFTVRVVPSIHSPGSALKDEGLNIEQPLRQPASMKAYLEGGSFDFLIKHHGKSIYVKPSPNFIEGALDSLRADVVFIGIATVTNHPLSWQEKFYEENIRKLKPSTRHSLALG